MLSFLKEFLAFMLKRKKFWLMPIILVLLIFGVLIVMTQGAAVAPFIYTIFLPIKLKILGYFWEKFGIFLGIIFSPIILSFVYIITIIPVNLIIRILNLDLIQKNFEFKKQSYWQNHKDKKINFRDQF